MMFAGFGAASVFTTTSIASQNAVEFHDLGVATATIMFFRSLGGSFGVAVFGTVQNTTIRSDIPRRIGVTADEAADLIRSPAEIQALPPEFVSPWSTPSRSGSAGSPESRTRQQARTTSVRAAIAGCVGSGPSPQ